MLFRASSVCALPFRVSFIRKVRHRRRAALALLPLVGALA